MRLKEILAERKRAALATQEPKESHTSNQVALVVNSPYSPMEICSQTAQFYALFEGNEDF